MYYAIARLKAIFRYFVYHLGVVIFVPYGEGSDVPGYTGSFEWRGRCIAFEQTDGTVQFVW